MVVEVEKVVRIPYEVIKEVVKIVERPIISERIEVITKYVDRQVEVPREVIRYVDREVIVEKPIYEIREIIKEKIIEVPRETVRYIDRDVIVDREVVKV